MNKNDILQKHFTLEFGHDGHGVFMQYILDAMEEYAKIQVEKTKLSYLNRFCIKYDDLNDCKKHLLANDICNNCECNNKK